MPILLLHLVDCLLFTWFCWYRATDATYKAYYGSLEKRRHFNQLVVCLCLCTCLHACVWLKIPLQTEANTNIVCAWNERKKKEVSTKTIMGLRACDSRNSGQPIENHIWYDLSKSMQLSGPLIVLLMYAQRIQIRIEMGELNIYHSHGRT